MNNHLLSEIDREHRRDQAVRKVIQRSDEMDRIERIAKRREMSKASSIPLGPGEGERGRVRQVREELKRLHYYRRHNQLYLGPPEVWAELIAYVTAGLHQRVTPRNFAITARKVGFTFDGSVADPAIKLGQAFVGVDLFASALSPARMGGVLEVTAAEREDCKAIRFDACDEHRDDRAKRKDKESSKKYRAKKPGYTPREESLSQKRPWEALGVSRKTWERHNHKKTLDSLALKMTKKRHLSGSIKEQGNKGGRDEIWSNPGQGDEIWSNSEGQPNG